MAITATERTAILDLVVGIFNAAPGEMYLNIITQAYEADKLTSSNPLRTLAVQLANTPGAQTIYPSFFTGTDFATTFLTPLGLQGNTTIFNSIKARYESGENKGTIMFDALNALLASTDPTLATAKQLLINKATVAEYYSVTLGLSDPDLNDLQAVLVGVTASPGSVTTVENALLATTVAPALSVGNVSVTEGDSGTKLMNFVLTLNKAGASDIVVNYASHDGTATAGSDYLAAAGAVTFAAGETSKTVSVTILGDTAIETNEAFTVSFSSTGLANATVATPVTATGTITNDDVAPAPFVLTSDAPTITEGDSGQKVMTFVLNLDHTPTVPVTVSYETLGTGTATAGSDFVSAAGAVIFAVGQTSATVSVTINGDTDFEGNETVNVQFSGTQLTGNVIATGTITNDDPNPVDVTQFFVLTPGNDLGPAFTGGVGPDLFTGTDLTFNTGDHLVGGDNIDTLSLRLTAATTAKGHFESIEHVNLDIEADVTLDATFWTGVTDITLEEPTANATVTNIQDTGVNINVIGGNGSDVTALFSEALMAGTTTIDVGLTGAQIGTLTLLGTGGGETEDVNIAATGDNMIGTLATGTPDLTAVNAAQADLDAANATLAAAQAALAAAVAADSAAQADTLIIEAIIESVGPSGAKGGPAQDTANRTDLTNAINASALSAGSKAAALAALTAHAGNVTDGSMDQDVSSAGVDQEMYNAVINYAAGTGATVTADTAVVATAQANVDADQAVLDAALIQAAIDASALENLVIAGSAGGSLVIGDSIGGSLATVDASGYNGALTLDITGASGYFYNGSTGNDDVTADSVNGSVIALNGGTNILRLVGFVDTPTINGIDFFDGSFSGIQTLQFVDDVMLSTGETFLDVTPVGGLANLAFAGNLATADDGILWLTGPGTLHMTVADSLNDIDLNVDQTTNFTLNVTGNITDFELSGDYLQTVVVTATGTLDLNMGNASSTNDAPSLTTLTASGHGVTAVLDGQFGTMDSLATATVTSTGANDVVLSVIDCDGLSQLTTSSGHDLTLSVSQDMATNANINATAANLATVTLSSDDLKTATITGSTVVLTDTGTISLTSETVSGHSITMTAVNTTALTLLTLTTQGTASTATGTVDLTGAAFGGSNNATVTIVDSRASMTYNLDQTDADREIIKFTGTNTGTDVINGFFVSTGGTGDRLNFHDMGLTSIDQLAITMVGLDTHITAVSGTGVTIDVTVAGVDLTTDAAYFTFN